MPKGLSAHPKCDRCRQRQAVVHLHREGVPATQHLCLGCFQAQQEGQSIGEQEQLRFFSLLARLHQPVDYAARPILPAETACPSCGLTFAEFESVGLAGCGDCYVAFAPAIQHALHVLHDLTAVSL